MRRRFLGMMVLAPMLFSSPAQAELLHASACSEINERIAEASPGDEVVVAAGTYTDCRVHVLASNGSPAAPIVLRSESIGAVTFEGNRTVLQVTRDHWIIEGFVWDDIDAPSESILRFDGCSHTVFRRNVIRGCTADYSVNGRVMNYYNQASNNVIERNEIIGVTDRRPANAYWLILKANSDDTVTDTVIRHNYVHDMRMSWIFNLGANGAEVLESRTRIEDNLFEDIGNAMHIKSSNNVVQNNTFRRTEGLDVRAGGYNQFLGNYILDMNHRCSGCGDIMGFSIFGSANAIQHNYVEGGDAGVYLGWGEKTFPESLWASAASANTSWAATESDVSNNTFVDCAHRTFAERVFRLREWAPGVVADIPPVGNRFARNIVVNSTGVAVEMAGLEQDWSENVVWSTSPGTPGDSPGGVEHVDPEMERNADGVLVSAAFPTRGARPPCRPLTPADVGPESTYEGCGREVVSSTPTADAGVAPADEVPSAPAFPARSGAMIDVRTPDEEPTHATLSSSGCSFAPLPSSGRTAALVLLLGALFVRRKEHGG